MSMKFRDYRPLERMTIYLYWNRFWPFFTIFNKKKLRELYAIVSMECFFGPKKTSFATNLNLVYRFKSIFLSSICIFSSFSLMEKGFCKLVRMIKWDRKKREWEQLKHNKKQKGNYLKKIRKKKWIITKS